MSTIKDVAKRANVSIATVSRVINGLGGVRPLTEQRVYKAIDELNYSPNALARSMVKRRTKTIGVIVPEIANPFFAQVIKGIEGIAREHGYTTLLANSNETVESELKIMNAFRERRIDGLILITASDSAEPLADYDINQVPIVLVDRYKESWACDCVVIDNVRGAYSAVKHLVTAGHTRIGLIGGPSNVTPGRDRTDGYLSALRDLGIPINKEYMTEGDFQEASGYRLGSQLLSLETPPSAIFSCNNLMTLGLLKCIRDRGLQLEKDVTVIGFDDLEIANFLEPPLTVVSQPMRKMGEIATQLLLERITGKHIEQLRKIVLVPQLVVGKSSNQN